MFLNRNKKVSIISAMIFVFMLSNVGDAMATALWFCPKWRFKYMDTGIGEDHMKSLDSALIPAFFVKVTIEVTDANNVDYDNPLYSADHYADEFSSNINDCVGFDNSNYNFPHRIRVTWHPDLYKGDARVVVPYQIDAFEPQDEGPPRRPLHTYSYSIEYEFTGTSVAEFGTIWPYINDVSFESNMASIGGLVLDKENVSLPYQNVEYPDNETVIKRIECTGTYFIPEQTGTFGDYYPGTDVCIKNGDPESDVLDGSTKFPVTHEIGHRISEAFNGPGKLFPGGYNYGDNAPSELFMCTCEHIDPPTSHCLQSRENIFEAQSEGWAHFYSTAVMNFRDDDDAWFGYYKKVNTLDQWPSGGIGWGVIKDPPYPVDATRNKRWMESYCLKEKDGVEWDWLNFFFNLWQDGSNRLDMGRITNIWDDTYDRNAKPYWYEIDYSAEEYLTQDKYKNFDVKAFEAGVQH